MALANSHFGSVFGGSSFKVPDLSCTGHNGFQDYKKTELEDASGYTNNFSISRSSSLSSTPSSTHSDGFVYEEAHFVLSYKTSYDGTLLSFKQNKNVFQNSHQKISHLGDFNTSQTATTSYACMISNTMEETQHGVKPFGSIYDIVTQELCSHKRPHMRQSMQATSATKKHKPNSNTPSKDPQSIAAKNRRERISERLKVLQDLVPNGSKVDLVTMLEKAISYVKLLQLQVKVLATDEFWPAQGGKALELSQVEEAIDAILSPKKDPNSSSKS